MKFFAAILLLCSLAVKGQQHYPIKNMLGVNVHPWDLIASSGSYGDEAAKETANKQNAIISTGFTWLRIYVDAYNVKDNTNTVYAFNPTINSGGGYLIDDAITALKANNPNLKINYCYQNAPNNIKSLWTKSNTQYRYPNTDPSKPETWKEIAHDMAVITARGGSNANALNYPLYQSPNWWDAKQVMTKGSKLYDQVEGGNEWDNNWSNAEYLNGSQYAIAWKVIYDSVKKVDPSMSVSTTGVMTEDPQILIDALKAGAKFDKYQFHCYPWGWSHGNIASALPPEYNMIPAAKKVVAAANSIPCIIGEWGYDLHPESNMGVRPFSNYTGEQVRSFWIMRSILGFAATGIESAYYYRIYQDYGLLNDNNPTIFETSSLFIKDEQNNITRRLSGDVFYQLSQYGDFVFDKSIVENDSVRVYRFKYGNTYLYTAWTIEKVQLVTINGTNRAEFTEVKTDYTFPDGQTIQLSSKPVFVVVNSVQSPLPVRLISFTAQKQGSTVLLNWQVNGAKKFEVERSADGDRFTPIAKLSNFSLVDLWPLQGFNFYRLKMIEDDGSFSYSPIARVQFSSVQLSATVLDITGRKIKEVIVNNANRFEEQLKHDRSLPAGVYIIQYTDNKKLFFNNKIQKLP